MNFFNIFRSCEHCERLFFSEQGLKQHLSQNSNKSCESIAQCNRRLKQKAFFNQRRKAVMEERLCNLGSLENLSKKPYGPLSTADKKNLLYIFDKILIDCQFKRSKVS